LKKEREGVTCAVKYIGSNLTMCEGGCEGCQIELLNELFPLVRQARVPERAEGLNRRCTAADTEAMKKRRDALRRPAVLRPGISTLLSVGFLRLQANTKTVPEFPVDTACFSCSPPDINLSKLILAREAATLHYISILQIFKIPREFSTMAHKTY
jgi:hypothetical protein